MDSALGPRSTSNQAEIACKHAFAENTKEQIFDPHKCRPCLKQFVPSLELFSQNVVLEPTHLSTRSFLECTSDKDNPEFQGRFLMAKSDFPMELQAHRV